MSPFVPLYQLDTEDADDDNDDWLSTIIITIVCGYCGYDFMWSITPDWTVLWRTVKSLWNQLGQVYLLMTNKL